MEQLISKKQIVNNLRKQILQLEGFKPASAGSTKFSGLEDIEMSFPNAVFPTGALHEFVCENLENAAASGGFIAGLLQEIMKNGGVCLWISTTRTLFPPALKTFGVDPDRIIFIDVNRQKDVLWAVEEALKCEDLAVVVGEVREINFAQSRRLQLAIEKSKVTGFILRNDAQKLTATTCVARWRIESIPSELNDGLPGVGFPRWQVELLKVRNGNPGIWNLEWISDGFRKIPVEVVESESLVQTRKIG